MATVNLVCENTRFDGNVETELRAVPVPEGQIVGENYTPPENCDIATGWEQTSFQFAELWNELSVETVNVIGSWIGAIPYLIGYALIILLCMFVWRAVRTFLTPRRDFTSLKTVTFGDESAVRSETAASFISIVLIFILWASFTGSQLLPGFLRMPAPYTGEATFTYVAQDVNGNTDEATVLVNVVPYQSQTETPEIEPGEGIARNDAISIEAYDSELLSWDSNDEVNRREGGRILSVNGQETDFDPNALDDNGRLLQRPPSFDIGFGRAVMNEKGALNIVPDQGWQMKPLYLPSPEGVWTRFLNIAQYGYQNVYLLIQVGFSLFRVIIGFLLGALIGIPLGYAMGLSNWFRGWFDPIVEFMRPVPPLALIPLVIIWFGIGEVGKITLLFLAALWIMAIAARSGVSGVKISKVHAAYSLGASRWQVLRHVIIPNSLPEIFTGARVAMGVCWGTVVAAELVAAEEGVGKMITTASKFQATEIIFLGVILIGIIGFGIDVLMRLAERKLVPWKGRG